MRGQTTALLEHLILDAWPARTRDTLHGWTLLADGGVTGRTNCVAPLTFDNGDLETAIDDAVAWQVAHGTRPCFKIAEGCCAPSSLRETLARRGWRPHTETLVMTAPISDALGALGPHRPFGPLPPQAGEDEDDAGHLSSPACGGSPAKRGWGRLDAGYTGAIDSIIRDTTASEAEYAERSAIAARTPQPRRFAILQRDDATAAVGLTVITGAWAAIFLMRTHPAHRRQGRARDVLAALTAWAKTAGATHAYLQVEAANAPAIALYRAAAFETAYSYSYWRPEPKP